jgi:hypothetical protein
MAVSADSVEMGKFRYGASEFMSYWLPMILVTGDNEANKYIAYIMVLKYRKAYLTKEEAEVVSKQELNIILTSVSQIQDTSLKATQIMESLKCYHYYPAPEYYHHWEKEWEINQKV